jgi:acetyl esterase
MNRLFSAGAGGGEDMSSGDPSTEHVTSTIEGRIRALGAVLDMPFTQSIYKPLLDRQPREGVKVTRDVRYGDDERHRLDIYEPEAPAMAPRPLLLLLPGGGFIRGDKAERENFGQRFAREGIVTAVANYRLAPTHRWPAGAEDVIAAYLWVRQNTDKLAVDPKRIFLAGESAGAAHVAAATLVRRFHPKDGLVIAGTVLISGVYNAHLERLARVQFGVTTPDPRNEAYFGSDFECYRQMSTIELIDAPPAAPLLITYAELDLLAMQVQAGELFARLVTHHGYSPQLRVIPGHNHLTQVYAVNTGDESLSAPLLEFLRAR